MAIAICGMAEGRVLPEGRELWGMSWDPEYARMDVLYDIHHPDDVPEWVARRNMDAWQPLYMQDNYYTRATRYPIEDVIKMMGDYYSCSIAFMLAHAIVRGIDDISLVGVTGSENYAHQRPCLEYLIGFARGKGLNVEVIGETALLKGERYGKWR